MIRQRRGSSHWQSSGAKQREETYNEKGKRTSQREQVSRRAVLKGGAAIAGSTAVTGFPMVWAQNLKDITLIHTGMSYSTLADIAKQASKDLGFKVEMSVVDHPGLLNRLVNDPKSIDIADMEIWQSKIAVPQGVLQGVEIAKIKDWGDLTPLYTEGTFAGKEVSRQGDAPIEFIYRDEHRREDLRQGQDRLRELRAERLQRRYARHPPRPRQAARSPPGPI